MTDKIFYVDFDGTIQEKINAHAHLKAHNYKFPSIN